MSRTKAEQEIVSLSKDKWRWMSERKVDSLAALFHDEAVFVHMGATMSKKQVVDVDANTSSGGNEFGAINYEVGHRHTSGGSDGFVLATDESTRTL